MAAAIQMNIAVGVTKCCALIGRGTQCVSLAGSDGLCKIHLNSRRTNGPLEFALTQLKLKQKSERDDLKKRRRDEVTDIFVNHGEIGDISAHYDRLTAIMRGKHAEAEHKLREEFAGAPQKLRDEQAAVDFRRAEIIRRQTEERRARRQEDLRRIRENFLAMHVEPFIGDHAWAGAEGIVFAPAEPVAPAGERGLGDIARDPQSIHTIEVLKHTKDIVAKVREIPVPEDYRWDKEICSKTPGEIISECKLPQKAAHQMMSQYALDTAIYDIEEGIYGKVLDSMWQFVKGHAEKDSLVAIIRDELTQGVGMCAQGNLTRVCNILAGYLDGVGAAESLADKLGRLLPPLREIESHEERLIMAAAIMHENHVPTEEWDTWLEAVMD